MMKAKHYLLGAALSLLTMGQTMAQQLSLEQARRNAEAFLQQKTGLRSAGELQLSFAVSDTTQLDAGATLRAASEGGDALLYAFSRNTGGFVIASGAERTHAVLAYGTEGTIDANHLPDGARDFLRQYAVEIATLRSGELVATSAGEELSYDPAWQPVEPLIKAIWGQEDPYNRLTPIEEGQHCLTGCPATMFAQLMDYYRYQNWKVAEETWFSGSGDLGEINRNVTVRFDSPVDWSLLRRNYGEEEFTEAEGNEVAKLMKYAGAALHVMYGIDRSSFYPHQALDRLDAVADYGKHAIFKYAWEYPLRTWSEKLYRQLAAGRPIAYSSAGGGHIFLLDGYAGDGMFHFNLGYGGQFDGYYLLTAILPQYNMHLYQSAFFDWCPSYMEPIESHRVFYSKSIVLDTTRIDDSAWQMRLMAFDPQPHSGTLRYTLRTSADAEPITSEPFDFAFTSNADYESDILRVPFPEYSSLDEPMYEVTFWQKQGDGWETLRAYDSYDYWRLLLRRSDKGYAIEWSLPDLKLQFEERLVQLHTCYVDTLHVLLSYTVGDLPIGMGADTIQPVLLRQGQEIELPTELYSFESGTHATQLLVTLPIEVEAGERCQLFVRYHSKSCSDTVDVEVRPGPELVLLEPPVLPDTVSLNEQLEFSFRVKNIGEVPYTNSYICFQESGMTYTRVNLKKIEAGEELEVKMGLYGFMAPGELQLALTYWIANKLAHDISFWSLCKVDGEPYTHTFYVVEDPTANEQITSIPETTVSWQGRTLCIESAVALKSYHIYNVQGSLIATGQINGTSARIDGSAWPTGVYVVAIEMEDGKTRVYKMQMTY